MNSNDSHWSQIAPFWHLVGPPLRPSREDILIYEQAVLSRIETQGRPMRAMILGVTPELASIKWPARTCLKVLDSSKGMIKALWKGSEENAIVGSWTASPVEDAGLDMIVCDGGVGLFHYPEGQLALLSEVKRMLAPNGIFTTRLFSPGCRTETVKQIARDLEDGKILSLDALKFRLWGALQSNPMKGVRPRDVVKSIEQVAGSLQRLTDHFGWSAEHVASLEFHRNSHAVYCLSSMEDVRSLIASLPGIEVVKVAIPHHVFGDHCPIISIRRVSV